VIERLVVDALVDQLLQPDRVTSILLANKAVEALDYAKKSSATPIEIDPIAIDRFTRLMREQLVSGDVAARKPTWRAWWTRSSCRRTKSGSLAQTTTSGPRSVPRANPRLGFVNLFRNGAQGRDRTTDTAIFSRMLYQLSYLGIPGA
jgi:hypothetical protein